MSYIWGNKKMIRNSKKAKAYIVTEESLPALEEAAVQYETLRVILGGNKLLTSFAIVL